MRHPIMFSIRATAKVATMNSCPAGPTNCRFAPWLRNGPPRSTKTKHKCPTRDSLYNTHTSNRAFKFRFLKKTTKEKILQSGRHNTSLLRKRHGRFVRHPSLRWPYTRLANNYFTRGCHGLVIKMQAMSLPLCAIDLMNYQATNT